LLYYDEGYTVADISLPLSNSGGTVETCWTEAHDINAKCPVANEGYFIENFTFDLAACPATLTGSFEEYTGQALPAGLSGTFGSGGAEGGGDTIRYGNSNSASNASIVAYPVRVVGSSPRLHSSFRIADDREHWRHLGCEL
jgi:hypothetical protein